MWWFGRYLLLVLATRAHRMETIHHEKFVHALGRGGQTMLTEKGTFICRAPPRLLPPELRTGAWYLLLATDRALTAKARWAGPISALVQEACLNPGSPRSHEILRYGKPAGATVSPVPVIWHKRGANNLLHPQLDAMVPRRLKRRVYVDVRLVPRRAPWGSVSSRAPPCAL